MARFGKYVVTGELGRSGRAVVHSALDPAIGRAVAIKVIRKAELDPGEAKALLNRFRQGAQAAGSLQHSNIVAIHEYGEDETTAWIAMELVLGKTLREHLAAGYRPGTGELPGILAQVLEALDYSHGRGVFHGNLHPGNVLVSEMGVAKISDFGFAQAAGTADERGDIHAAARIVDEVLGGAKLPAEQYASVREYLEALRGAFKPKGIAGNLGALRRAVKAQPEKTAPSKRLPAVLFVDDEERVLNALSGLFDGTYDVATASSGAAALERLKEKRFLVVVSDQRMPGMTGVEFLRQAKALAPNTVRLLLTGYSDLAAIVGSVNDSEVFRFVSKPWQQDELQATLGEAVSVAIALEAAGARGAALGTRGGAAVLVIGDPAVARAARELSAGAFPVLEAASGVEALDLLAREEVGVLVCDLDPGSEDPAALLRVLKEQSPQTLAVVTSDVADAEQIIGLINEARIHRFLARPVNLTLLQQALGSALERHARLLRTPDLARSERARRGRDSAQARSFLARIKALGGRFARAIGGAGR